MSYTDIREFEMWRDRRLARAPKTSTLNNFASAWNRVIGTAVDRGFISERVPVPRLSNKFPNVSLYRIAIKTELDIDFQQRSKATKPMTDEQKRIRYGIEVSRLLRQARLLIENAEAGVFPCVKPLG